MKNFLTALSICFGTALFAQSSNTIDVTISGQTSREQLAQLRRDLHAQGIVFNYAPQFDHERHLTGIRYKVATSDNVQIGEGSHEALQQPGANITFHVNPSTKTFSEEKNAVQNK